MDRGDLSGSRSLSILMFAVLFLSWTAGCGNDGDQISDTKVIYGEDNRRELFDGANNLTMTALAASTVALVRTAEISSYGLNGYKLSDVSLGTKRRLCESEPFFAQPSPAHCSGFLIGDDLIATAGHCIRTEQSCEETAIIFGFAYKTEADDPTVVDSNEIYSCRSIVHTEFSRDGADFAVIRLDRKVKGHQPLKFRRYSAPYSGTWLTIIGHPSGLPTKIAAGAAIRHNSDPNFLVATTDSFGGNSGSAVFNAQTGIVEGILVRGERDYELDGDCYVSKRCGVDECRGEDITRANLLDRYSY